MNHPEKDFVNEFRTAAMKHGCAICIIPDPTGNFSNQKYRPFDSVLVTPDNVFCIEAKVGKNQLLPHQKGTEKLLRQINPKAYYVIRKQMSKVTDEPVYRVEHYCPLGKLICKESRIIDGIVKFFMEGR